MQNNLELSVDSETPSNLTLSSKIQPFAARNSQRNQIISNIGIFSQSQSPTKPLLPHIRQSFDQKGNFTSTMTTEEDSVLSSVLTPPRNMQERIRQVQILKSSAPKNISLYDQPIYTISEDQEPLDLHKKIYVRLFKRSEKRREILKKAAQEAKQGSQLGSEGSKVSSS